MSESLVKKLAQVYETINHIDKAGHNDSQNYYFVRSADMVRAVRKELLRLGVYAEITMEFAGPPYTIARAKYPNAPFSAVDVICSVLFIDSATGETRSARGLGTGADTGDKAVYKAQTGALKYTLKNAFLVPDEADPEADESVDEHADNQRPVPDEPPDFQEASRRPSTNSAVSQPSVPPAVIPPKAELKAKVPEREPGEDDVESQPGVLPTEDELTGYRKRFSDLGDRLSTEGKLKSSRNLPINRKLLVFLLSITGASDAKSINRVQWDNFFSRADAVLSLDAGAIGLAKLVNKTNNIEEKTK